MSHQMAQEHEGTYDALRSGTARTQATIAAALTAIGSAPTRLVLSLTGDGIWTIASNTTIPANVTLVIPPGVTVNRASGVTLTLNGPVMALQPGWETGPGSTVRGLAAPIELSAMRANQMTVYTGDVAGQGISVQASTAATTRQASLITNNGGNGVALTLSQDISNNGVNWQMLTTLAGALAFAHPGGAALVTMNNSGVGIGSGFGASLLLQLQTDSAGKPSTNTWSVVSDVETKEILGEYTAGMAHLKRLPRIVRYRYNGTADTPVEERESVGYVAQELQAVAPSMVRQFAATIEPDGEEPRPLLGTNLGEMFFLFTNCLKELDARLTALEGGDPEAAPVAEDPPRRTRRKDA